MVEWVPIWALPNIRINESIEGGRAALVSIADQRIIDLANKHKRFRSYLTRFTDAFNVEIEPSILLAAKPAGKQLHVEPLASFRDLVAIAVIPYARSLDLVYGGRHRVRFSNSFWLYPWMLDKDYEHLLTNSLAQLGVHDVSKFRGQATPEIFPTTLDRTDIDQPLLEALLHRWNKRYWKAKPSWEDIALFRSLNMANVACQLPAIVDATVYDIGRSLSLWVSAFEILAHPGKGKSDFSAVCGLLNKVNLHDRHLRQHRYILGKKPSKRVSLVVWLYHELYRARNDFLHGNPVTPKRLRPTRSTVLLSELAPPLYRLALTGFLDLRFTATAPPADDLDAYIDYRRRLQDYFDFQHLIERGLLRSRRTKMR